MSVLLEANLSDPLLNQGKVRENYELGDKILMVATDRISAFDVILPCGIPDKGMVLNLLSAFWFEKTAGIMPNHMLQVIDDVNDLKAYRPDQAYPSFLAHRSMVVKKVQVIPVECVVRGYLSGSAWAEYTKKGTIHGVSSPSGLLESQKLPESIFTPTTKEESGHDQPISFEEMARQIGNSLALELKEKCLAIYRLASEYASTRGIIIADTKMEFGLLDNQVVLIDELLTPDSSRFWDADIYEPGHPQPSFDKQMVRDWLESSGWDKEPPAPELPADLIQRTSERYQEVYQRLTGIPLHK